MKKLLTLSLTGLVLTALLSTQAHALRNLALRQMGELPRDQFVDLVDPEFYRTDKMIVQFSEDTRVRLLGDRLVSLEGQSLAGVEAFLKAHPEIQVERVFQSMGVEELDAYVERGERLSGIDVADLNNFYLFTVKGGNRDAKGLLTELLKQPIVQTAYYEAIPSPAVCGSDPAPATPNWTASQDYREAAPTGVDINYAWSFDPVYGRGQGWYWFQDLEWGWTETHEDFGNLLITNSPDSTTPSFYNHGTAVMSIVGACDDGKGMTGLTPDVRLTARVVSNHPSTADALIAIGNQLLTGETYLIEMHAPGPNPGWACVCNCSQFTYIAMEYWTAEFNAVLANSANGRTCIEAAGNGSMDLDWAGYGNAFNLGFRDSGAIVVGAGTSGSVHNPECWTNHGSRISAQGWGDGVYAAAYGDLFNPAGDDQDYTAGFSGTSSASPIVAGAAMSLALIHRGQTGSYMSPWDVRGRLTINGTPQGPTDTWKEINVLPNMKGILAPDLSPYVLGGWADSIVPSDVTGTTTLPANLQPDPAPTYVDWGWANWSLYGNTGAYQNHIYVDDVMRAFNNLADHAKNQVLYSGDINIPVRGGLHYVRLATDVSGTVTESVEDNNQRTIPYRWEPTALASDAPQTFTRGPKRTPQGYSSAALDGFGNGGWGGWWDIAAVMPAASADYDIYLYNTDPTPTSGWNSPIALSGGVNTVDFVGSNNNAVGDADFFGVINYNDSNEDYTVEREGSTGIGSPPTVPTLISSNQLYGGEILDVYEMYADDVEPIRFVLDITYGNADVAVFIYGPSSTYFARSGALWTLNAAGNGVDEAGTFTPAATGWHGIVVCKNLANQVNEAAGYDFYWGPPAGDLTSHTPAGWTGPVVARNSGMGTTGVLPPVLTEGATVLDAGVANFGSGDTPFGPDNNMTVDGIVVSVAGPYVNLPAGWTGFLSNRSVGTVKGGRHEVGSIEDAYSEVAEELPNGEFNNATYAQYAWAPSSLTNLVPESRSPLPNWANYNNPDYWLHPFYNQDGYVLTTAYWSGVAAMPTDPAEYVGVYAYDNADNGSTTSLVGPVESSYVNPGEINFSMANGNVVGYGTPLNVGVTNAYAYPYALPTMPYTVQLSQRLSDLYLGAVQHNTLTAGAGGGQILHTYDVYLNAGQSYPVTLFNNSSVDLGVALFTAGDDVATLNYAAAIYNSYGAAQGESGTFTAYTTGWHGVAVYRTRYSDLGPDAAYGIVLGGWAPQPVIDLSITMTDTDGTDDILGFSLDWSDVTYDSNYNPLAVDHYNCYYSSSAFGGWMQFTTEYGSQSGPWSIWIGGDPDFYFMVTAVDENGVLLASSRPFQGPLGGQVMTPTSRILGLPAGASQPTVGTDR
jgi:serine protease